MRYKHLGHSSNKTIQRYCCKDTFNFWLQGRPKTLTNAHSPLLKVSKQYGHADHFVHGAKTIFAFLRTPLIGQAVSERRYLKILVIYEHVYSSATGADNPLEANYFFKNIKSSVNLVICSKFFPLNDFLTVFPIRRHVQPNLALP